LNPEHWDPETGKVRPEAFRDKYESQSFYAARLVSGEDVLRQFAEFPFAKKLCGKSHPTAHDLYEKGYGIANVRATIPIGLELVISEIKADGHVNVTAARDHAIDFAEALVALSQDEIFGR